MNATTQSVNKDGQAVPRAGFVYDIAIRGADTSFWKAIAGSLVISSNKIRANADTLASYTQFKYGRFIFPVNVPTTPSGAEAKKWGLLLPGDVARGSMYFEIAAAVFKAVSYDDDGTVQSTTLTWSGETVEQDFEIEWEKGYVIFKIEGVVVATHQTRVGTTPLPLYLHNADADNTDVGNLTINNTAQYV